MGDFLQNNQNPINSSYYRSESESKMCQTQPIPYKPADPTRDSLEDVKNAAQSTLAQVQDEACRIREGTSGKAYTPTQQMTRERKLVCADAYFGRRDQSNNVQSDAKNNRDCALSSSIEIQNSTVDALRHTKKELLQRFRVQMQEISNLYDQAQLNATKQLHDWRGLLYNDKLSGLLNAYVNLFNFATRYVPTRLEIEDEEQLKAERKNLCKQMKMLCDNFERQLSAMHIELRKEQDHEKTEEG